MMDRYDSAHELPAEWDQVGRANYALQRDFLRVMETANPCAQRYYGFRDAHGSLDSIVMTLVQERLNLLMFTPFAFSVPATLIYVPISASTAGMACGTATRAQVAVFLSGLRGLTLVLNLPDSFELPSFARVATCPRIRLALRWSSFEAYLNDLRSGYRRRAILACRKAAPLTFRTLADTNEFTIEHFSLYEQVYNKSSIRVEKLSLAYFQTCPATIIVAEFAGKPVGFVQLLAYRTELIFGFIGLDYTVNREFDLYQNLMLKIVDYGITHHYTSIDLGQTADETKLKLGGDYELLYAHLRHHNPLLDTLLRMLLPLIAYRPLTQQFHVFKSSTVSETATWRVQGSKG